MPPHALIFFSSCKVWKIRTPENNIPPNIGPHFPCCQSAANHTVISEIKSRSHFLDSAVFLPCCHGTRTELSGFWHRGPSVITSLWYKLCTSRRNIHSITFETFTATVVLMPGLMKTITRRFD